LDSSKTLPGILICLIGIIGVVLITNRRGRAAGLALAAFFGASVAFFVMPPMFSFRIHQPYDLATLIGYGLSSLIALHLFRRPAHQHVSFDSPTLHEERSELYFDRKISEVIANVAELAKASATVAGRTSIHSAYQPGLRKVWIVAQRRTDAPLPHSLIIGLRDEDCQRIVRPDWPANCSVTWFDNGAERVYQISIQHRIRQPLPSARPSAQCVAVENSLPPCGRRLKRGSRGRKDS
jgi:hypothetical protein